VSAETSTRSCSRACSKTAFRAPAVAGVGRRTRRALYPTFLLAVEGSIRRRDDRAPHADRGGVSRPTQTLTAQPRYSRAPRVVAGWPRRPAPVKRTPALRKRARRRAHPA
jgi:hypothetical protein